MYQVVQLTTDGFRNIDLVLEEDKVISQSLIRTIDNALPSLMMITNGDVDEGVRKGDVEPFAGVLQFCHDNNIRAVRVKDPENNPDYPLGSAKVTATEEGGVKEERFVAAIGDDLSAVEYGSVVEALIYGYANQNGYCN